MARWLIDESEKTTVIVCYCGWRCILARPSRSAALTALAWHETNTHPRVTAIRRVALAEAEKPPGEAWAVQAV